MQTMSNHSDKVKVLFDKVQTSLGNASDDYIDTLFEAQAKGKIRNLRFEANQDGLVASFSFNKKNIDHNVAKYS